MRQSYFSPILSGSLSSEDYLEKLRDTLEAQKTVSSPNFYFPTPLTISEVAEKIVEVAEKSVLTINVAAITARNKAILN